MVQIKSSSIYENVTECHIVLNTVAIVIIRATKHSIFLIKLLFIISVKVKTCKYYRVRVKINCSCLNE